MTERLLLLSVAVVAGVGIYAWTRRRPAPQPQSSPAVTILDIARVFAEVDAAKRDGTFAVFLFGKAGQAPAAVDALNIQFSTESGRTGLDWVLLAPSNLAEETSVREFLDGHGSPLSLREQNGVKYLRTEKGDLAALCEELLRVRFGVTPSQTLQLIAQGFEWHR